MKLDSTRISEIASENTNSKYDSAIFIKGLMYGLEYGNRKQSFDKNHDDQDNVSFDELEIKFIAEKFGIKRWEVTKAIEENKFFKRQEVYDFINKK